MARLSPEEGLGTLEDREETVRETWKKIHPAYEVSDQGRVRRYLVGSGAQAGRVLKPSPIGHGYLHVVFSYNGEREDRFVHLLVAEAFIGPCPAGYEVNHKDGNKSNCRLKNLEYVTPAENTEHAMRLGLKARGSRHGRSKLNELAVSMIKKALKHSSVSSVARMYKIGRAAISKIKNGRTWAHVEGW